MSVCKGQASGFTSKYCTVSQSVNFNEHLDLKQRKLMWKSPLKTVFWGRGGWAERLVFVDTEWNPFVFKVVPTHSAFVAQKCQQQSLQGLELVKERRQVSLSSLLDLHKHATLLYAEQAAGSFSALSKTDQSLLTPWSFTAPEAKMPLKSWQQVFGDKI